MMVSGNLKKAVFILCGLLGTIVGSASGEAWKQILEEDGVKVYSMSLPNSDLVAFKGIKVVHHPIDRLAFVLLNNDVTTKKDWIDRLGQFIFLEESDKHSVFYSSYNLPWPISDRDFIVKSVINIDHSKKRFALQLKSIDHQDAPETVGVRGELLNSLYQLTAINNESTLVEMEIHSDPKGLLPKWLVNLIQESWPYNTIMSMERQVAKPHNRPHPLASPLLNKNPQKQLNSH